MQTSYSLSELTHGLAVEIRGDCNCKISGIAVIQHAKMGDLTFLNNPLYKKFLPTTQASAIILDEKNASESGNQNLIVSKNPYLVYAKIAEFFQKKSSHHESSGIHPYAIIGKFPKIHESAIISPFVSIGDDVTIGENVFIGPGCVIDDRVIIKSHTRLEANIKIYHDVVIGSRVNIASGVVLGGDGFGFAQENKSWYKIPQLGSVIIGDDVDIGANTCIDRGAIEDTIIEDGVKLDNLIQIGHNVTIGKDTIVAGCVGIAGSTKIGRSCMIGGGARFNGHITIADEVIITGMTVVEKSISTPGMYSSGLVGVMPRAEYTKHNARFYRLENLMKRVKQLEEKIKNLE